MSNSILLFEDKLGISQGYESIWQSLLLKCGLGINEINRRNSFKSLGSKVQLLIRKGNRVTPGFNPDPVAQKGIEFWAKSQIRSLEPKAIVCMDPALLFMLNPDWDQATLDNLRGGIYYLLNIPTLVSLPISAWHQMKKEKDIARMNEGFVDQEEYDEEHGGDEEDSQLNQIWMEPVTVPYGKFVLRSDLEKLNRILRREK